MRRNAGANPRVPRFAGVAALLFALGAGLAGAATMPSDEAGAKTAPARPRSALSNLPGYKPLVDPESSAVLLGRRTSAPLVSQKFSGGSRSLDNLGRTVVRLLHRNDRDSLLELCVNDLEFSSILWREFPQSRPATGLQWEDAWRVLYARQLAGCGQALDEYGGEPYQFVRFEHHTRTDSMARYRNFTLHNGLVMVVRSPFGDEQRWEWLRSVAERKGVFKIYSTTD